ncbi:hypothetical protein J7M23_06805, partial [Candidatus Sumerlaeota bacterium]|nr:hypothetical protein [Candidatus Sumerlaeota bacterium]
PAGIRLKSRANGGNAGVGQIIMVYVIFLGGVVLTFLPWAVKNLIINHNPVFPFLSTLFPSKHWTPAQEEFYLSCRHWVAPWEVKFWLNCIRRSTTPGVLYLFPALLTFLIPAKDIKIAQLRPMVLFSLMVYLIWNLWSTSADRFLVAIVPILAGATIQLLWWLWHQSSRLGRALAVIFCIAIALQATMTFTNFAIMDVPRYGTLVGLRDEFRKNYLGEFSDAIVYVRENLPADSKLLLLYEARPYYFDQPVVANSVFDQSPLLIWLKEIQQETQKSPITLRDLLRRLKDEGITHCLVNEYELLRLIKFYTPEKEKKAFGFPRAPEEVFPLYPPWLNDRSFPRFRGIVREFLSELKAKAEFRTSDRPITIYITSLDSLAR